MGSATETVSMTMSESVTMSESDVENGDFHVVRIVNVSAVASLYLSGFAVLPSRTGRDFLEGYL